MIEGYFKFYLKIHIRENFDALNNLYHLLLSDSKFAVKNSRFAFFEVRELVWEVLSEMIKKLFSDPDLIRDICVTLDKVTVFNIPYSVVCTYYFLEGGLHVLINGLIVMEEDDYCGVDRAVRRCSLSLL